MLPLGMYCFSWLLAWREAALCCMDVVGQLRNADVLILGSLLLGYQAHHGPRRATPGRDKGPLKPHETAPQ